MTIKEKDASRLVEIKSFIREFKDQLPSKVDANELRCRSKLPWTVMSLRGALLYRITDLSESACHLYEVNMLASAFTLTRAALETSAMLYWLYMQMEDTVKSGSVGKDLNTDLKKALLGRKDKHVEPINVLTYLKHLDKKFKGVALQSYFDLSEYAHPNWFGVMSLYGSLDIENRCANLAWPESGARIGEGLPLLFIPLGIFKFYFEATIRLLPDFKAVCDKSLADRA